MKALVYSALKTLEIQDVPEPSVGPGEVKVRVCATGVCGSDLHGFLGHSARRQPGLVLGHETMGVVTEGDDALIGRRVSVNPLITCGVCPACRAGRQNCCPTWRLLGMDRTHGGFAESVVVPGRNVHPIPDSVSDSAAVMVEPLANAFHILSMIPPSAGSLPDVAIVGGGTLGACILSVCLARGFNVIVISEPNPLRAGVMCKLGAKTILNPIVSDVVEFVKTSTDEQGVAVAIDAVGSAETRNAVAKMVSRGGTALLLGLNEGPTSFDFFDLIRREVRLQTSFAYTDQNFAEALDFVVRGAFDYSAWTDVLPLEQGQEAFEKLIEDPKDRIKIALTP
jgi:threonine dehydrogenase-like Zn-dependent dehydrogenase